MKFEQTKVYGGVGGGTMAKSYGEWLWYNEAIQIKFSCPFQFQNFPFDSHKCCLEYGGLVWNSHQMLLQSARILYRNMTSDEGLITIENLPFPFDMKIESLPAFKKANKHLGSVHSRTGMCFTMRRNSYGQLLSGFYYSTLSFAVLSLVSFLINPDIVSHTSCIGF